MILNGMKGTWDRFLIRFVQSWFVDCLSQDLAFVTDGDVSAAYNTCGVHHWRHG